MASLRGHGLPRAGLVGVALLPGLPRDVPVTESINTGERLTNRILHNHDVTALSVVQEPLSVGVSDVDAAVRLVDAALCPR